MDNNLMTAYLFKPGELGAVLSDVCPEKNPLSPISFPGGDAPLLSEGMLKLREYETFRYVASILCCPDLGIDAVKGGGMLGAEHFGIFGRIYDGNAKWTALLTKGDAEAVLFFSDTSKLVEWFAETFAVKAEVQVKNYLPSVMNLEEWIVLAHTIDAFRRAYMESMLLYKPGHEYSIKADDFIASLNVSLESGDVRWLLPAFFAITPGLAGLKPDIGPQAFQAIESTGLISHGRAPGTNEGLFTFTADGMTLGLEFASSWMYGVGFRASVPRNGGEGRVPVCFLAPTSLGNHMFSAEKSEDGTWSFRHEALTFTGLAKSLKEWMDKVISVGSGDDKCTEPATEVKAGQPKAPDSSVSAQTGATRPSQDPNPRFCIKCGNKLTPGVRFCARCGNRVA